MFQVHHWPEPPGAMISPLQFDVLFLTVFSPPFPSGCGSFLLVPAEGFDLLHTVCGSTHRGKCVMDTSPEFPYTEFLIILPT